MMSDRLGNTCHPLIYLHPKTGRPTLCFHQGMTHGFARDYDLRQARNESDKQPYILNEEVKV